jgi:hypothetical protein
MLIYRDATALVRFYTDFFEPDVGGGSLSARSVEQGIAENLFPALESSADFPILKLFSRDDFFPQVKNNADIAHMIGQGFADFLIDKIQYNRSLIDEDGVVVDSNGLTTLKELPKSLIVVGTGVIGTEYASMLALLRIQVTLRTYRCSDATSRRNPRLEGS